MLSILTCIILDYTCLCSPYIAWRGENIDEADMDVTETGIALVCYKQLAQFGFVIKRWLEDLSRETGPFGKLAIRERNWLASLFCSTV